MSVTLHDTERRPQSGLCYFATNWNNAAIFSAQCFTIDDVILANVIWVKLLYIK